MAEGRPDPRRVEPLRIRVEHNRRKLVWLLLTFLFLTAAAAAIIGVAVTAVVGVVQLRYSYEYSVFAHFWQIVGAWTAAAVLFGGVWSYWSLHRAESIVLARLKAVRVAKGELMEMKSALKDMGLAAGVSPAPEPWVMPYSSINAAVLVRDGRRPKVVVTRGLLRQPQTVQRAVFANLIARILSGDAGWGTAGAALMGPVFAMRDRDIAADRDEFADALEPGPDGRPSPVGASATDAAGAMALGMLLYVPLVIVTEILAQAYRTDAVAVAEAADADGMLLLKDPAAMMRALQDVLPADNYVPVTGGPLGVLCFAWPGWEDAPGGGDLEMVRIGRMREVLGAEGIDTGTGHGSIADDGSATAADGTALAAVPSDGR